MVSAVEVVDLRKSFGSVQALDSLRVEIPEGSIFGIIGPNGAGKSTFVRILLDLVRPTSGTVRVLGKDPRRAGRDLRASIGYLPGEFRTGGRLTGDAHLRFWAAISRGRDSEKAHREGLRFADMLEVDLHRPLRALSKGNKQKLGIIQAFMHRPPLLILDEPTSGLDPLVQQTFRAMVTSARDDGATVLLSSHVLSEVEDVADSAAVLRSGRIVAQSTIEGLRATAARTVRAIIAGSSAADVDRLLREYGFDLEVSDLPGEGPDVVVMGRVDGKTGELIKVLAHLRVRDLIVTEPDLEESVLHIYSEET